MSDQPQSKRQRPGHKGEELPLEPKGEREKKRPKPERRRRERVAKAEPPPRTPGAPGPARLYALLAGGLLSVLGVLGFFYDATFGTGTNLTSDDLAGILLVNGWRNVVYLVAGVVALALAARRSRVTALGLGLFFTIYGIWGMVVTDRGIGSILDLLPLTNRDNALHLVLGGLGLGAALIDGPLPSLPSRLQPKSIPKPRLKAPKRRGAKPGRQTS